MRAEVKEILCLDVASLDFADFCPDDLENFACKLQLLVGPHHHDVRESFDLMLCTPKWLIENHAPDDVVVGRHMLIVFEFGYERIVSYLRAYVARCTGNSWQQVAEKVGRLGRWEFEDYVA